MESNINNESQEPIPFNGHAGMAGVTSEVEPAPFMRAAASEIVSNGDDTVLRGKSKGRPHSKSEISKGGKMKKQNTMADYFLKILILGDTGVGKSSILSSYTDREFPKNIVGTAGIDHKVKDIMMKGK